MRFPIDDISSAGHASLTGQGLDGEAGIAIWVHQELAGAAEDARTRLFGSGLALAQAIRAGMGDLTPQAIILYSLYIQINVVSL
jgi:hypothetical protein